MLTIIDTHNHHNNPRRRPTCPFHESAASAYVLTYMHTYVYTFMLVIVSVLHDRYGHSVVACSAATLP